MDSVAEEKELVYSRCRILTTSNVTPTRRSSDKPAEKPKAPMKQEDVDRLKKFAGDLPRGTRLHLTLTRHDLSDQFQAYGRKLKEALPGIDLVTNIRSESVPPWMETENGIRFQALPEDSKLDGLIEALLQAGETDAGLSDDHRRWLTRMTLPVEIRLYIAPNCPYCPQALKQWVCLARAGRHLRLHVIDGTLFPEKVLEEKIKAVPTLVLDRHLRWSGRIPVSQVLEQLATRDPSRLSSDALDGIIKEGQAVEVAQAMIAQENIFPAIFDLLTHTKWPVRLGAMVVMEEIAASNPRLATEIVPVLIERYGGLADPIRGDVLYVIGETGDQQAASFLEDAGNTSADPDVRQAAREALNRLDQRSAAEGSSAL